MRKLILVIEQDPIVGKFLSTVLEEEGYAVHVVSDTAQALYIIEAIPPALVVLDYCVLNDALLQRLHRHDIPVIMLSDVEASLAVNASYSNRRPFDPNHLLSLIERSMRPTVATLAAA